MIDKLSQFLRKNKAFTVISVNDDQYIILTKIAMSQHKEVLTSVFQPYTSVNIVNISVFFLLTDSDSVMKSDFKAKGFPILDIRNTFLRTTSTKKDYAEVIEKFMKQLKN